MQWYCITFNPNCWRKVEYQLGEAGLRCFMPKMKRWVSHARTKTAKEFPILSRYMFVECEPGQHWIIRAIHGVEGFVEASNDKGLMTAVPIEAKWVEGFIRRYLDGEWDHVRQEPILKRTYRKDGAADVKLYRLNDPYPLGARVALIEGEFSDMLATVTGRQNGKLLVLPKGQRKPIVAKQENVRAA